MIDLSRMDRADSDTMIPSQQAKHLATVDGRYQLRKKRGQNPQKFAGDVSIAGVATDAIGELVSVDQPHRLARSSSPGYEEGGLVEALAIREQSIRQCMNAAGSPLRILRTFSAMA
jgi:hypothetical protein